MTLTKALPFHAGQFLLALALSLGLLLAAAFAPAFASEIKVIVNGVPITSYDLQRRRSEEHTSELQSRGRAAQPL